MKWFLTFFIILLTGCSGLPSTMRGKAFSNISLATVNANPAVYQNKSFRWGGTIINVANEKDSSQVQILYYPLSRYGSPLTDRTTQGRFAITSAKFLDPAIFKEGVEVTVTGILSGEIKQQIGKKALTLPLLEVEKIHIWSDYNRRDDRYYPQQYYYPSYHFNPFYRHDHFYGHRFGHFY